MKIIITGAGGLVATELITNLLKNKENKLYLISTHVETIEDRYSECKSRVSCYTLDSFAEYVKSNNDVFDICIHTAFARSGRGDLIVSSLDFQRKLLSIFNAGNLKTFINISSQSVYGKMTEPLWTENAPLDPDYLYAMGKYSSEVITELVLGNSGIRWANIRLCSVCENARFVRIFVQNAINGTPIHLTASEQGCSFIDVRDVANALETLIQHQELLGDRHVFNLGSNLQNTIKSIALLVKEVGEEKYHTPEVAITEDASDNNVRIGMDASLFMKTFNWAPEYAMKDMVVSLFEMLTNVNGGGIQRPLN